MIEATDTLVLTVYGPPQAQVRARGAKMAQGVRFYKAPKQQNAELSFISQIVTQLPAGFTPYQGPLQVDFYFYLNRPKSHYGTGKNTGKLKNSAPRHPTSKPDFDNTIKHVCDCLNKIAWDDDRQICRASVYKGFADNYTPLTRIFIKELFNATAD